MREIKFRAWDKDEQQMLKPPVTLEHLLRQVSNRQDNSIGGDAIRRHRLEWTQFTGLQDDFGKEIYEGDIVNHRPPGTRKPGRTGVVSFSSTQGVVIDVLPIGFDVSVIGNIYENPELLKATASKVDAA